MPLVLSPRTRVNILIGDLHHAQHHIATLRASETLSEADRAETERLALHHADVFAVAQQLYVDDTDERIKFVRNVCFHVRHDLMYIIQKQFSRKSGIEYRKQIDDMNVPREEL